MYTKEQMQKVFDAGYANADDSYPGPGFEEFLTTLTPEPSADVVEKSRTWLEWRYQDHCRGDDRFVRLSDVQSIIEAEVERRVRE